MGTLVRITVSTTQPDRAQAALTRAFARIHELDLRLSNYLPQSEVNHFDPAHPSPDLRRLLDLSQRLTRDTHGAFDPTRTALYDLWRAARQARRLPTAEAIAAARQQHENRLDLGAIAKGYAADEALRILQAAGEPRALIAVSGDLAASGPPHGQPAWRVRLDAVDGRVIPLQHRAVSTSGDTEQYLEADGQRYSHIVDPRTGYGLTNHVIASVVARHGILSDALATVVCLLGIPEGTRLARRYGAQVYAKQA